MKHKTTIQIMKTTRKKLEDIGRKKETYDDIINKLLTLWTKIKKGSL